MGGGGDKRTTTLRDSQHSTASAAAGDKDKKAKEAAPQASLTETLDFAFQCGAKIKIIFCLGFFAGICNGLVYPALAYLFSSSFTDLSSAQATADLSVMRELAFTFMIVGVYALVAGLFQSWCFEILAYHATQNFRLQWFSALLRQDTAYFDVHDAGGIAGQVGPSSNKYRRGVGRKFGEGIQFLTTGIGGVAFGFYASWPVAFVVLGVIPFASITALMVMKLNQSKTTRQAEAYKSAGSIAYSSVSSIKTVLSLNAIETMIDKYNEATQEAYNLATGMLVKQGFWNGSMLGSFLMLYCILTLFGTFLLYRDIEDTGCDPSGAFGDNTCKNSGPDVFGAMLGIAFAAQGISQFGNFSEALTQARVAAYDALQAINRKPGAPEETIYAKPGEDDIGTTTHSRKSGDGTTNDVRVLEEGGKIVRAIIPKYEIDSTSDQGLKPVRIRGHLAFKDVRFTYPTRPNEPILNGLSLTVPAGKTVAFVGPSGSGKSTVVAMLERFYDPQSGSIELDGVNLTDINVAHLRHSIGYVGQEPTLFATTIRANIQYGNPEATFEEIQEAARLANAHDFISSFSDGYDTQVGDKGSQLSGGQKQRIAIARILVGNPKLLILDEATSALDSESELVVQEALDNILEKKKLTTVIIAHRLSTIRNCDIINVLVYGELLESGTHDELMEKGGYYKKLVEKQDGTKNNSESNSAVSSRSSSAADLKGLAEGASNHMEGIPHISFRNVKFAYPTRPKKIIFDGFNLDIEQGSTVALVGPSGGGKSTTVGLLERFYDPIEGAIEYQGYYLRGLNVHWYRDQIGYVGQEPTLFNDTIANNIAYGCPGASRKEIEEAARQANALDFIMNFEEGFDTMVGERGGRLSGGQKQRVAIARALVKKPRVLILDEATSALDNESEALVQAAIDKLMESREHTCIVIAHRLSTIRNADKIAFIAHGGVVEQGTHEELIAKPHGRYKRLFDSSKRDTAMTSANVLTVPQANKKADDEEEEEEEIDWEAIIAEEEAKAFNSKRARQMASPDKFYFLIGAIGACLSGSVFPTWGILFSETINLLFQPVFPCNDDSLPSEAIPFPTCETYYEDVTNDMRSTSFQVAAYWVVVGVFGCVLGSILTFYGFGTASERMNKRLRDSTFKALLRQEVAFFDKRSVGSITSQLQDDTGRIQAFSAEPVRSILTALSSVVIGVTLSFFFMWQFALLAIACVPVMGFATSLEMKKMLGEDQGDDNAAEGQNSPGGVIVETLLNIRTVAALTLEKRRFEDYKKALEREEPTVVKDSFMSGLTSGLSMFIQQWVNALQLWFGGWLLVNVDGYELRDFLIANFAILFSLFGLGAAFQDISDRKEVEKAAGRIFYLLDRVSEIDPLSEEGNIIGNKLKKAASASLKPRDRPYEKVSL